MHQLTHGQEFDPYTMDSQEAREWQEGSSQSEEGSSAADYEPVMKRNGDLRLVRKSVLTASDLKKIVLFHNRQDTRLGRR